jgi:regulator of sigma E protease
MLTTILTIIIVAILFGMTIFVHELGHFLAARWCGFTVDTFSIGFGPALWKRKVNGVVYKIGSIPFGGYVALPQLDPTGMSLVQGSENAGDDGAKEGNTPARTLSAMPAWKRIIVSSAGAIGNMIFAVVLAWIVFIGGKPATPAEESALVGYVATNSGAYASGLRIGDEIQSVNGENVKNWTDFLMACSRYKTVDVVIKRQGVAQRLTIPGEESLLAMDGKSLCMILAADPGMSADRAGLKRGDIITALDGQDIISRAQLIALVGERKGKSVPITFKRNNTLMTGRVTPDYDDSTKLVRIGVQFNPTEVDFDRIVHPAPMAQLKSHSLAIFKTLQALTTPKQSKATSKQIGGPLAILISYYFIVKASLMVAVFFTGFLNVNLAILNLLPIPVLDGGHIVFCLIEMLIRRPIPAKIITVSTNVFATLLIGLFILLTYRDALRFTPLGGLTHKWLTQTNSVPEQVQPTPLKPDTAPAPDK